MKRKTLIIEDWRNRLGLFPNKLFKSSKKQFVLLNGDYNSFGIDYEMKYNHEEYYNYAWSSDIDSFITFDKGKTNVYKLSKGVLNRENYDTNYVKDNLELFYNYLGKDQLSKENKIVPYVISIFNQLRNYCDVKSGNMPLKALLYLFATINDGENPDLKKWGIDNTGKKIFSDNNNEILSKFVRDFKQGLISRNLKPELNLILRHCSSKLFQEAHYNALLLDNQQHSLFGDVSSHVITNNKLIIDSAYFTPTYLIRSIVEESLHHFDYSNKENIIIFDPACGSGEFLKEAISQLRNNGYKNSIKVIGWDISESAIDLANFVLHFEKQQWSGKKLQIEIIKVEDSLIKKWPNNVDLLFMNPPYKSWELMEEGQRDIVQKTLNKLYENNPNLASAFLWKAIESSKKGAIIGSVLPSSIFNADSYLKLRDETSKIVSNKFIGKLGNYIFLNALVDASIYITQKGKPEEFQNVDYLWSNNIKDAASNALRGLRKYNFSNNIIVDANYSVYSKTINQNQESWLPISYEDISLKEDLKRKVQFGALDEIGNIFNIMQGVRTGKNNLFLINKSTFQKLPKSEKKYFRPAVTNKAIKNGYIEVDKYIWFPYGNNIEEILTEGSLKEKCPIFYKTVLMPNKTVLKDRNNIRFWWDLSRYYKWNYDKVCRLLSTEFGKSDSFAFDKSGDFVVERGHAWIPKNILSEEISYAYLAIFSSSIFDKLLSIYSKQIAGGNWYYLGNKFVTKIPIPDLTKSPFKDEISKLSKFGFQLSNQETVSPSILSDNVKIIYGIT